MSPGAKKGFFSVQIPPIPPGRTRHKYGNFLNHFTTVLKTGPITPIKRQTNTKGNPGHSMVWNNWKSQRGQVKSRARQFSSGMGLSMCDEIGPIGFGAFLSLTRHSSAHSIERVLSILIYRRK